jgi:pimeloyl-ACP methyl ester carboxylesterase
MGSRTLAELIAMQALSRRFLDTSEGRRAVDMIQQILQDSNRVDIFKLACQAMIDMDLRPLLPKITAPTLIIGGDEDMMTPWQELDTIRESGEAARVFGVPSLIVEGELFWGREHLADIREKLAPLSRNNPVRSTPSC